MKRVLLIAVMLCLLGLAGAWAQGFQKVEMNGVIFQWKIEGGSLHVIAEAKTTGWVAVGFDPSSFMKDANIIIGCVKGSDVVMEDQFGNSPFSHVADIKAGGTSDLKVIGGKEENGSTTLEFSIPLDSGDSKDRKLSSGQKVKVIFAYARDGKDDFSIKHSWRTSFSVNL